MDAPDDSPQIGRAEVDRAALSEVGVSLTELAIELGVELDAALDDIPQDGWRVLRRQADDSIILGAPTDSDGEWWRFALVRSETGTTIARVLPDIARLRPSRVQRRAGLELRWPAIVEGEVDSDAFVIDVVNVGEQLWTPDRDDSFHTVGVLTPQGVTTFAFGWVSSGHQRAVPLGPGEYARLSLIIDRTAWADLQPGPHDLHAVLPELNLRSPQPLRVDLTAEVIAQHQVRATHQLRDADQRRQSLEDRIGHLSARLYASEAFTALAEAVATARSDEEALALIGTVLDRDRNAAQSVYHSPLSEFRPGNADVLRRQIEELTQRLDAL